MREQRRRRSCTLAFERRTLLEVVMEEAWAGTNAILMKTSGVRSGRSQLHLLHRLLLVRPGIGSGHRRAVSSSRPRTGQARDDPARRGGQHKDRPIGGSHKAWPQSVPGEDNDGACSQSSWRFPEASRRWSGSDLAPSSMRGQASVPATAGRWVGTGGAAHFPCRPTTTTPPPPTGCGAIPYRAVWPDPVQEERSTISNTWDCFLEPATHGTICGVAPPDSSARCRHRDALIAANANVRSGAARKRESIFQPLYRMILMAQIRNIEDILDVPYSLQI